MLDSPPYWNCFTMPKEARQGKNKNPISAVAQKRTGDGLASSPWLHVGASTNWGLWTQPSACLDPGAIQLVSAAMKKVRSIAACCPVPHRDGAGLRKYRWGFYIWKWRHREVWQLPEDTAARFHKAEYGPVQKKVDFFKMPPPKVNGRDFLCCWLLVCCNHIISWCSLRPSVLLRLPPCPPRHSLSSAPGRRGSVTWPQPVCDSSSNRPHGRPQERNRNRSVLFYVEIDNQGCWTAEEWQHIKQRGKDNKISPAA